MVWLLEFRRVFFFFQAEDGIRDDLVTGVQTCALPISLPHGCACQGGAKRKRAEHRDSDHLCKVPVWLKIKRSEEHTSELQSPDHLVCRLLLEKKKKESIIIRL